MKFLIDECLSPSLAAIARERGYPQSTHVTWLGLESAAGLGSDTARGRGRIRAGDERQGGFRVGDGA